MKDIKKKYTNGEVTIVWQPQTCIHSTICWKKATGLPEVFNPSRKPWIEMEKATTNEMVEQVKKCPSGALSYYMNDEAVDAVTPAIDAESIVEVVPDGPLLVYGNITIKEPDGTEVKKNKVTAFCRCGGSGNKPFCDGTHTKNGFKG
ncbi:MAG: (4Fe-4S)-binding protein [Filimonas sp.]|nr:(4Fe-4S)-binding protein [Filimonas sp.]